MNKPKRKLTFGEAVARGVTLLALAFSLCPAHAMANDQQQRIAAANTTAERNGLCKDIAPFYWEIGDGSRVLASGSTGDGSITRETRMPIASASKMVFGAYVIQRLNGNLDAQTQKALKMMSGYTNLSAISCGRGIATIQECFDKGSNSEYSRENDGKFFYNGGHFQKWAVDHGMGAMDRGQAVAEYQKYLGSDFDFSFGAFQMAGGIVTSAADFSVFLRKILSNQLLMKNYLGANPTCTFPRQCPQAVRSPVRMAWHYSYAHWVEDDPEGDGAFSSPGAFGFYPWIDASKQYYGIIARASRPGRGGGEIGAGVTSAMCGKVLRKAYFSGSAQN